jgi:hypothetical protein
MAYDEKKKSEDKDMVQEYNKLKAKYSLPDFSEMDKEFSIGNIEPGTLVLRNISFKIAERCGIALKILGDLIQPENHLADMQEAERLSQNDKDKVVELFKKLSYYERDFLIRDFDFDEKKCAELIVGFYAVWIVLKQDFLKILISVRDTWKVKDRSTEEYGGYFG